MHFVAQIGLHSQVLLSLPLASKSGSSVHKEGRSDGALEGSREGSSEGEVEGSREGINEGAAEG
jgi:hypothetical protein